MTIPTRTAATPERIGSVRVIEAAAKAAIATGGVCIRSGFGNDCDRIATHMASALGLSAAPVWHTDRTAVADYASRLSLVTGSLGKFGQDVVLMAQQGIDEITIDGGGGSSAMPHKSNPYWQNCL